MAGRLGFGGRDDGRRVGMTACEDGRTRTDGPGRTSHDGRAMTEVGHPGTGGRRAIERGHGSGGGQGDGPSTRRRILQIALTLMSQRGVDGTSMRDLASAAGLNVASLYHYFPSKRDLLEAVLVEQGFVPIALPAAGAENEPAADTLARLLEETLTSMFEVEEFVRLMVGEAIRGDQTARAVGSDLFSSFHGSIERWISDNRPDLDAQISAAEIARVLSAMVVGVFVLRAAGVIDDGEDAASLAAERARDAARILQPRLQPPDQRSGDGA